MIYSATLNQKGQVTIQKDIRKKFKLGPLSKVKVIDKNGHIEIWPQVSFLNIAGKIKSPAGKTALKGRDHFDKEYTRV